jgi:hypothetical protein
MALLYGRDGHLTSQNDGFWSGQSALQGGAPGASAELLAAARAERDRLQGVAASVEIGRRARAEAKVQQPGGGPGGGPGAAAAAVTAASGGPGAAVTEPTVFVRGPTQVLGCRRHYRWRWRC